MKFNYETLYRRIALLFHAEATRHSTLTMAEYIRLLNIVDKYWAAATTPSDPRMTDALYQGLKDAFRQSMRTGEAMQLFQVYYTINRRAFDYSLKKKIVATFQEIANAFTSPGNAKREVEELEQFLQLKADAIKL